MIDSSAAHVNQYETRLPHAVLGLRKSLNNRLGGFGKSMLEKLWMFTPTETFQETLNFYIAHLFLFIFFFCVKPSGQRC